MITPMERLSRRLLACTKMIDPSMGVLADEPATREHYDLLFEAVLVEIKAACPRGHAEIVNHNVWAWRLKSVA